MDSCLSDIDEEDSSLANVERSKRESSLILSDLELPTLPYVAPNIARILIILCTQNCPMALWEDDLSLLNVY